ncbi:hypothetical protein CgunFtcFv8_027573 [Champsocephalus gunnari]|uniref:Uncharacterized protein n=1 Tax=Champsocephalus gunnari TaxID=52237 RepID=A0AAN8E4G6_CHAGU|nr:hypothetical protein CgunFtcFv8_027573 [Champsocephalus gunnari]
MRVSSLMCSAGSKQLELCCHLLDRILHFSAACCFNLWSSARECILQGKEVWREGLFRQPLPRRGGVWDVELEAEEEEELFREPRVFNMV